MNKKENPGYYAIIPAVVRYDKSLSPNAKLLYGEITALAVKEGYAYASNKYFADLYGVNKSSITNWINQLRKADYIKQELIYNEDKSFIIGRRIYLTNKMPSVPQKPDTPEETSEEIPAGGDFGGRCTALKLEFEDKDEEGGGQKFDRGGQIINQGGGQILQERILHLNITNSAAADSKPEISNFAEKVDDKAAAGRLKHIFKTFNANLIFDNNFYPKALAFLEENSLDDGYLDWLYHYCLSRKPENIAGFYFKVFFELRLVELYRESARPPPVTFFLCPVCNTEHDAAQNICPRCGLKAEDRSSQQSIDREKKLYALGPEKRTAYESELNSLFHDEFLPRNFEENTRKLKNLEEKYGLSGPPE